MKRCKHLLLILFSLALDPSRADTFPPVQSITGGEKPIALGELGKLALSPITNPPPGYVSAQYSWVIIGQDLGVKPFEPCGTEILFGTGVTPARIRVVCLCSYLFEVRDKYGILTGHEQKTVPITAVVQLGNGTLPVPDPAPLPNPVPAPIPIPQPLPVPPKPDPSPILPPVPNPPPAPILTNLRAILILDRSRPTQADGILIANAATISSTLAGLNCTWRVMDLSSRSDAAILKACGITVDPSSIPTVLIQSQGSNAPVSILRSPLSVPGIIQEVKRLRGTP